MRETLVKYEGLGLAANQLGHLLRLAVLDVQGNKLDLINPEILESSGEARAEEGCLSFPGVTETIKRAESVKIKYIDREGEAQELEADGLLAIALQHEIDHLDGITLAQRASKAMRPTMLRKLKAGKKEYKKHLKQIMRVKAQEETKTDKNS